MTSAIKKKTLYFLCCLFIGSGVQSAIAHSNSHPETSSTWLTNLNPKHATLVAQVGGFNASQGQAQNIGIDGLIGDRFTLDHHHDNNGLFGLGYYVNGFTQPRVNVLFGLNAFYFMHTTVTGKVIQEQLFTNLSYHYSINNYPIYAAAKIFINDVWGKDLTFDVGVGPNFIEAGHFSERSLDGGVTLPDNAFKSNTSTAFSVTAGMGLKFNHLLRMPCELSYRFFYLGQGSLSINSSSILTTLRTGNNYANAITFSIYA